MVLGLQRHEETDRRSDPRRSAFPPTIANGIEDRDQEVEETTDVDVTDVDMPFQTANADTRADGMRSRLVPARSSRRGTARIRA